MVHATIGWLKLYRVGLGSAGKNLAMSLVYLGVGWCRLNCFFPTAGSAGLGWRLLRLAGS